MVKANPSNVIVHYEIEFSNMVGYLEKLADIIDSELGRPEVKGDG